MNDRVKTLLSICLILGASRCLAGPVNLFQDSGTTKQFTYQANGNKITISGTDADTIDDPSFATSWSGYAENQGLGGNDHILAQWDLTFAVPVSLQSITGNIDIWSSDTGSTDRLRDGHFTVSYRATLAGPLTAIFSRSYGPDGGDGQSELRFNETDPLSSPSAAEVVVEAWAQAFANNGQTNGSANAFVGLSDIQLLGQSVPEPASIVTLSIGVVLGLAFVRLRRARAGAAHEAVGPPANDALIGPRILACAFLIGCSAFVSQVQAAAPLDVNDISYLWPVPNTADDIKALVTADDALDDGSKILSQSDLTALIDQAKTVQVVKSSGGTSIIDFSPFEDDFRKPATWKVVSFRVDPSAPSCDPKVISAIGSAPQIRLILQPVQLRSDGTTNVHDFTMHLVYFFIAGTKPFTPDRDKFSEIVSDLVALRDLAAAKQVPTKGPLSIHPALKTKDAEFNAAVVKFFKKHVTSKRLLAISFMGVQASDPWIFFAVQRDPVNGALTLVPNAMIDSKNAQMLTFRVGFNGPHVVPMPTTINVDGKQGVSTSLLYDGDVKGRLKSPVFSPGPAPLHEEIPNIIADPRTSHFVNTDCFSCHSESARRNALNLKNVSARAFTPASGISGVDPEMLPKVDYNVRNFGWFPVVGSPTVPTISQRTANETADCVEMINRIYVNPVNPTPPASH